MVSALTPARSYYTSSGIILQSLRTNEGPMPEITYIIAEAATAVQSDDLYIHNLQYILVSHTNKNDRDASDGVNDSVLMFWHFKKYLSYVAITRPN